MFHPDYTWQQYLGADSLLIDVERHLVHENYSLVVFRCIIIVIVIILHVFTCSFLTPALAKVRAGVFRQLARKAFGIRRLGATNLKAKM